MLRRKTSFWVWSYTYAQIRPCWIFSPRVPFSLLLPVLWGCNCGSYHFPFKLIFVFLCVAETIYLFIQALFPSKDWWVVPAKVVIDQTVWAAIWNSIYYVALGFLRRESPANIYGEVKSTFWPMLTVRNSLTLLLLAFSPLIPLDNILLTILVL